MVHKKGFSLMELMVVIGFIGIMTAVSFVFLGENRSQKEAESAAREVAATVREAQNNALTGYRTNEFYYPCRHWVRWISSTRYRIVYEYKTSLSADCATATLTSEILSDRTLPYGVQFDFQFDDTSFDVPHAVPNFNAGTTSRTITLQKNGKKYNVCIYPSGRVEEKKNSC